MFPHNKQLFLFSIRTYSKRSVVPPACEMQLLTGARKYHLLQSFSLFNLFISKEYPAGYDLNIIIFKSWILYSKKKNLRGPTLSFPFIFFVSYFILKPGNSAISINAVYRAIPFIACDGWQSLWILYGHINHGPASTSTNSSKTFIVCTRCANPIIAYH